MIGRRIEPAWPVRADAPQWRGKHGETLAEALLDLAPMQTMPVESAGRVIQQAVHRGDYVGVKLLAPQRGWLAVWHPVMVAWLSELGLDASNVRMTHHNLHGLVLSGDVQPAATVRHVPGIGPAWHYLLKVPA